jgi:protocatechuate 3,4-dioxygenase beta subunit
MVIDCGRSTVRIFLRQSLGSLWVKLLVSIAFSIVSLTVTVLPAHAAAPAPAGSTGYDISWPQCPSSFPAGGAFGIVGVTNGLAFSANPCLGAEYAWASSRPYSAGLYINTGNPETASSNWAGRAGVGPRTCTTANLSDPSNVDCAYNYGWNAATNALNVATTNVGAAARTLPWWLDVEIANSWNGTLAANSSTVQGYIDYQRSQSTGTVGIYSTGYQWGQITGGYTVPSSTSTPAAPDWLAGASSVSQAAGMCDPANSFSGGPVQLVQYPSSGFDGDYVCGVSSAPDYSLSLTPSSQSVVQGSSTTYTVTVAPSSTFNGAVQLSAGGLPAGAGATFSPNPATSTSTMTVTTSPTTPTGSSTITVTGTNGSLSHSANTTLAVTATNHSISGTVKDSTGAAVSGVWVYAYQGGAGAVCCTYVGGGVSDSSGNYTFALSAGTYKFYINPPAPYLQRWNGGIDFASATAVIVSGPTVVNITLVAMYGISGTVKDGTGAPVGGVWVYAYQGGAGAVCCTYVGGGVSDSIGNYSFGLPAGTYKLFISPPAPYLQQWNGGADFASATAVIVSGPTVVNITLVATSRVSGTVKDATGAPVSGVWVYAYQGGAGAVCCTYVGGGVSDSSGNYSITLPAGTYKFYIYPPAPYLQQWNGGADFASATAVIVSGPTVVNITLVATSTVSGTVKNAGGSAVGGVWVYAYQGGAGAVCCTYVGGGLSNSSGNYSFELPAGTYKLFISPPAPYSGRWYGGNDFGPATAVIVSGPTVVNITLH